MNICKKCVNSRLHELTYCCELTAKINNVTGIRYLDKCRIERDSNEVLSCGPEGKFFKKRSLLQTIFNISK